MRILLADDEASIRKVVGGIVADAGHDFVGVEDGAAALEELERGPIDLVIMDVMMPKLDGYQTCFEMRRRGFTCPVIFLSAKDDIVDKSIGFQTGADDYLTKPFDPRELMMHVEAHLRRANMPSADAAKTGPVDIGRFRIDPQRFQVTKDGAAIRLTPKEFRILLAFARQPDVVLSKEQLVEAAWGREFVGETSSITVFIKKLRGKIEDDPSDPHIIETLWGVGYKLVSAACE